MRGFKTNRVKLIGLKGLGSRRPAWNCIGVTLRPSCYLAYILFHKQGADVLLKVSLDDVIESCSVHLVSEDH